MPSGWADRALIAVAAAALLAAGCGGDMKQSELADSLDTLESSAAEAALVADGAADDRTKTTFVRVRARELSEELDHEAEKLSDASAGPDVATDQTKAIELIGQVSTELDALQTSPQDTARARAASARLEELADAIESLREHL